jgi:hypothetical protein
MCRFKWPFLMKYLSQTSQWYGLARLSSLPNPPSTPSEDPMGNPYPSDGGSGIHVPPGPPAVDEDGEKPWRTGDVTAGIDGDW